MEDSKAEPPAPDAAAKPKPEETAAKETAVKETIVEEIPAKESTPIAPKDEEEQTPPPLPPRRQQPSPIARKPPSPPLQINKARPEDFDGEIETNNELPSPDIIRRLDPCVVLDRHGKSHTFRSLYTGPLRARRVLLIFVRHFFCGNCQEFLRSLSEAITPDALLSLPISTFIAVVGCGDPALIDMYVSETNCPFPVYTDPQRMLFDALGMTKTLAMGLKPAYMRKSMARSIVDSVVQGLKQVPTGYALKSGDQRQVGGEFLFEPYNIITPREETVPTMGVFEERFDDTSPGEEKRVTWCHRMKTTRDHAEIPELMKVLGLNKGAGLAGQMRELGLEQEQ